MRSNERRDYVPYSMYQMVRALASNRPDQESKTLFWLDLVRGSIQGGQREVGTIFEEVLISNLRRLHGVAFFTHPIMNG